MKRLRVSYSDDEDESGRVPRQAEDREYFKAYSRFVRLLFCPEIFARLPVEGIHQEMIRDEARTKAYQQAMITNPSDFKDKIVLDVGCGTGILSIFAAQAGAKHVYAIDASDIIDLARELVAVNGLSDRITLIKGKMEEVVVPESVDVIMSEWMGYSLLYESMLPSVLFARDCYLKPGGKIYPSEARVYIALFSDPEYYREHIELWGSLAQLYNVDFAPLLSAAKHSAFDEVRVEIIEAEMEMSFPSLLYSLDLYSLKADEIYPLNCSFSCKSIGSETAHGLYTYFDVVMKGTDNTLVLSTSPSKTPTHWQQSLMYFTEPLSLKQDAVVKGDLVLKSHEKYSRSMAIEGSIVVPDLSEPKCVKWVVN